MEFESAVKQTICVELASGLFLFSIDNGHEFSRIVLYLTGIIYLILTLLIRVFWKKHIRAKMAEGGEHSLYIVTSSDIAAKVIQNIRKYNYNRYNINGVILVDRNMTGQEIEGVPVITDMDNAANYICQQWVDEVLINVSDAFQYPEKLHRELLEMGLVVHLNLAKVKSTTGQKQFVERIGSYTVLTTTMNYATDRQAFAKRALDILGGLVGCYLYRNRICISWHLQFTSVHQDRSSSPRHVSGRMVNHSKCTSSEACTWMQKSVRQNLMTQITRLGDEKMFKLDFDPRVIGNKSPSRWNT